jgi:hypothetical protein
MTSPLQNVELAVSVQGVLHGTTHNFESVVRYMLANVNDLATALVALYP